MTAEFAQWYYLIYLLPGGTALLLLILSSVTGGGRHHRAGAGHHHAPGGHRPVHGQAHPHHAGPKQGARHGARSVKPSAAQQALAFFGVGRVPDLFLWGSALLGWGLFGFWATRLLEPGLRAPAAFVLPSLGLAILGAIVTTKLTAEAGARLLPRDETYAIGTVDLCGQTGTVVYAVDEMRGRIHAYDMYGTLHDVSARVAPGQPAIAKGRRVLVTDFDAARGLVIVEELP